MINIKSLQEHVQNIPLSISVSVIQESSMSPGEPKVTVSPSWIQVSPIEPMRPMCAVEVSFRGKWAQDPCFLYATLHSGVIWEWREIKSWEWSCGCWIVFKKEGGYLRWSRYVFFSLSRCILSIMFSMDKWQILPVLVRNWEVEGLGKKYGSVVSLIRSYCIYHDWNIDGF